MALIQVTPDLLEAKAAEVRSLKAEHDEVMAKMGSLVHALDEIWRGDAQAAFVAKFEGMQPTLNNFAEMLENYATLMDTSARTLREADEALKVAIGS
jgi:WXG100 family type VII secretion target